MARLGSYNHPSIDLHGERNVPSVVRAEHPVMFSPSVYAPTQVRPTGGIPVEMARRSVLQANRLPQRAFREARRPAFRKFA